MARLWLVIAVVAAAFTIYSLVDCAMTERLRIRGPRKGVWLLIILLLPVLGGVLWFTIGKGRSAPNPARTLAPDDDPAFLSRLSRDADQEERIRRLEQQLADLDADLPDVPGHDSLRDPDADGDGGEVPGRRDG